MAMRVKEQGGRGGGGGNKSSSGGSGMRSGGGRREEEEGVGGRSKSPAMAMMSGRSGMPVSRTATPPAPPDDDDDSDVEMLSISSEDEVSPSRPAMAADRSNKRDSPDAMTDAGSLEEDYEPRNWKAVREEELVWRVREMREKGTTSARADSAAQLRRSSLISGDPETLLDPLGLGTISLRTMTLIRQDRPDSPLNKPASLLSKEKPMQKKLSRGKGGEDGGSRSREDLSTAPDAPIDVSSKDKLVFFSNTFDPRFYLARIHKDSAVADLKAGQAALKRDMQTRKEQLKKLVKDNFDCFVSCKNTIDDIHLRLQQVETDTEGAGTTQLHASIESVADVAKKAFGPLLERQAQAERIRSVQGLLLRFRTLFNLPCTIRELIRKKEYDQVVREYKKAKSLILPSKLGILKKVLEEIDNVVREFKDMLYRSMENPDLDITEVEKIVTLLSELEPESDPIWHFLCLQDRRIRSMMEQCVSEAEGRMSAMLTAVREQLQSDPRWKPDFRLGQVSEAAVQGNGEEERDGGKLDAAVKEAAGDEMEMLDERLIRRLTSVIVRNVPGFWQLTISIFSGKFGKVALTEQKASSVGSPQSPPKRINKVAQAKFPQYYQDDTVDDGKYNKHSQGEVVKIVMGIIGYYISKVQGAFLRMAGSHVVRPYMREAVTKVVEACAALKARDCAPETAVIALLGLRTEVTRIFVSHRCTCMREVIAELIAEEEWIPVPTVNRNGTPYAVTSVPLQFGDLLMSAMDPVSSVMGQTVTEEVLMEENMTTVVKSIQDTVRNNVFESFVEFSECLGKMAAELTKTAGEDGVEEVSRDGNLADAHFGNGFLHPTRNGDESGRVRAGVEVTATHQRLLLLISNSGYCRTFLLLDAVRRYQHLWAFGGGGGGGDRGSRSQDGSGLKLALRSPSQPSRMWANSAPSPGSSSYESESEQMAEVSETMAALEDKLLDQYLRCKATSLGLTAVAYLTEDGMQWGSCTPPKGLRDASLELIHPLVAVHAEVYSGARPFTEKAISGLAEALMMALKTVCTELKVLDGYGFCQLCLELDYFETVLAPFATHALEDIIAGIRSVLLEKAVESGCTVASEDGGAGDPSHHRRASRDSSSDGGSIDIPRSALGGGMAAMSNPSPLAMEDIQGLARSFSQALLANELKRTRINVICFTEAMGDLVSQGGGSVGSGALARRGAMVAVSKPADGGSSKGGSPAPGYVTSQPGGRSGNSSGNTPPLSRAQLVASQRFDGVPQRSPSRTSAMTPTPRQLSEGWMPPPLANSGRSRTPVSVDAVRGERRGGDGGGKMRMNSETRRANMERYRNQAGQIPRRSPRPDDDPR